MTHSTDLTDSVDLSDRIILVTGASSGIGRTIAKAYAARGATIILLARSIQKLTSLYDEIVQAGYPEPAIYPFNLATASPDDYTELAERIEENFGRLDGLLHNAGMLGSLTPIEVYPIAQWYEVLQVNLNSAFLLTQSTLKLLKRSKAATIIFTTQAIQEKAKAFWGAYSVSKFGLDALMQILKDELEGSSNIRIERIVLDRINTGFRHQAYPFEDKSQLKEAEDLIPLYLSLVENGGN